VLPVQSLFNYKEEIMKSLVEFFGCATKSLGTIAAPVLLSLQLLAQQPCGVSVNIIPAGKDTIQGPAGPVERCIYRVLLLNSRNDVYSVRFDPIASSTKIWAASVSPPSAASGTSSGSWWFQSWPAYPTSSTAYQIGSLYVSGPALHQFRVTFRNANEQTICWIVVVGQCETRDLGYQGGCLVPSINISTGFNPATGSVIPITPTSYDPNWIVISDPLPTTNEPRPASVITSYANVPGGCCWHGPLPGTQWIAVYNNPTNSTNGVYVFERCFCIEGRTRAVVELQVLADDIVDSILVCGRKMTNRTPNYTHNWFVTPPRIYRDTVNLQSGTCCIRVYVRNTNNFAFGLDISGSITTVPTVAPSLLADTCCSKSQCWIVGQKIHDLNCNGKIDQGEPPLSGWTITAIAGSNTYTATTGSDGWYSIQVPPGTYTLTEQVKPGFTPSTPSGGPFIVTIAQGQVLQYDFLNCTAQSPCDTIGEPRLDSACCQFTIPIFPVTSPTGVTQIQWSLSGGTMESITNFTGCNASYPNPYGQTSGTITFTPACTNSPMNLGMEVTPTTASGVVTLYLTIYHGPNKVCRDTLQLRCSRAPITKCDGLAVAPYIFNNLQQSWRTFTITNLKQPASPIKEVKISFNPMPCSPTYVWTGGGLKVDNGNRSWGYTTSGTPPYSQISMACPPAQSGSAPQGAAAINTVQFNLGVDYTCNWTGSVTLTVIHCDGDTCVLTYPNWCAKPSPKQCIIGPPIEISLGAATSPLRIARLLEVQVDTALVPGRPELHACNATVVPVSRGWDVVGVSIEDELTQDERESGRYRGWVGSAKLTKADAARWALVELQPCKQDTKPIKNPWILRATLASREARPDTPRVAITFYDADGNPIASDTAKAAMQVTSVPVEVVRPAGGTSGILQVVPNPAAEEVRVEYVLARPSEVTVEVCDLLGKCQLKAELGWMPAGTNSFGMSTADLPTGSYILRLRTSDGVLTAPLRIVR